MKIGLSYSRCIKDIVDGKVDMEDVLVIISRTDFDPNNDEQWKGIWEGYHWHNPEWYQYPDEDEQKFRDVTLRLYDSGRLHQPRQFGAFPIRRQEFWLETCLPDFEMNDRPAVKKAWDQFQTVAGLTNTKIDKEYQ